LTRGNRQSVAGPEFDLSGRVILITGSQGQIGSEVADAFVAYGASVVLSDIDESTVMRDAAAALAARYEDSTVLGLQLDVTSEDSVGTAFATIDSELGRLDVLVNNAAIDAKFDAGRALVNPARFENYPLDLWGRSVEVNLTGLLRVTQWAIRKMLTQGGGNIINVASSYGIVSPNQSLYDFGSPSGQTYKPVDYVGTKAAIPNLTRYLATLYGSDNIRCNCIVPHGVDNNHDEPFRRNFEELSPMKRLCRVEELRGPFVFLASDASKYMTGAALVVDGGWTAW
jgi:NAD(P)-dependent dehydrogenase (short-subunit alcohol dehydrogenase family)